MKKSLSVVLVLVLLAGLSTSVLAERFGRPGANLAKGQWSLGLEYNYIEEEIDLDIPDGWVVDRGEVQACRNQVLVRAGYGLTDKIEAFLKMGGTATDVSDAFVGDTVIPGQRVGLGFAEDSDGNMEFTIAGGLACTIIEDGNFKLGVNGTLMYFTTDDTAESRLVGLQGMDADIFKVEGALMASYKMGKVTPYGGVVMSIHDADARYRTLVPAAIPLIADIDVDQEDWFGMVVGANMEVADNVNVGLELTHVSEGVGLSVGVNCAL